MNPKRQIILLAVLIVSVISLGTAGYVLVEGWNVLESVYMTVITLTTVGFMEVHPLSDAGRIFTTVLILSGVGTMLYSLSVGAKVLLEGELREIFGRRKLSKKIEKLEKHYIICGYGRMGRIICREMTQHGADFVVVEKIPEIIAIVEKDILLIQGDATQDAVLKEAGIERASGLISVLSTDADNLYVVLSARGLNQTLRIVARASDEGAEQKLVRAGADSVVSPYFIGGLRIAHRILKPAVVDFIEFATKSGNIELQMEEIKVKESSHIVNKALDECGIRKDMGIIIVAIKRGSGEMEFNPTSTSVIKKGDTLVAMGETRQLKALEELVGA